MNRRVRGGREKRRKRLSPGEALPAAQTAADLIGIATLAMEGLGRASMRACFTGREVEVVVPDAATAAIFRAVIAQTARARPTDRLIRILVA
jgi:hypothetical protein